MPAGSCLIAQPRCGLSILRVLLTKHLSHIYFKINRLPLSKTLWVMSSIAFSPKCGDTPGKTDTNVVILGTCSSQAPPALGLRSGTAAQHILSCSRQTPENLHLKKCYTKEQNNHTGTGVRDTELSLISVNAPSTEWPLLRKAFPTGQDPHPISALRAPCTCTAAMTDTPMHLFLWHFD